jgi:acyl-ACP thioesterase
MKDRFRKTFEVHLYDLSSHKQLNPVKMVDCFNDAAGSHSESVGYSVESIFKKGYAWILLSWNIRVEEIPQLREKVLIETWISQIKRCFVNREFIMMNNLNQILIRASSRWIFYHIHKKRPAKIFSELSNQWTINSEEACHPSIMTSVFLKQPIYGNREKTFLVQEKDIDSQSTQIKTSSGSLSS